MKIIVIDETETEVYVPAGLREQLVALAPTISVVKQTDVSLADVVLAVIENEIGYKVDPSRAYW